MAKWFEKRAEHLTEKMEDPHCNKNRLFNTYEQFSRLNGLIARWETLFKAYIIPLNRQPRPLRILDIGCGGGDLCFKFASWANESGLTVQITGIDPEPRAAEYRKQLEIPSNVEFRLSTTHDLIEASESYDVVVSNHLLHHLNRDELLQICEQADRLAKRLVLFNDIRRSGYGFAAFGMSAPLLFRSSYIVRDGLTSIRRSYRFGELKRIAPDGWEVKKLLPFRLLLIREKD